MSFNSPFFIKIAVLRLCVLYNQSKCNLLLMEYENMNAKNNEFNKKGGLESRMPKLTEKQKEWAGKPSQKTWAIDRLGFGIGYCWNMPDHGLSMQVYNERTFRLLTVVDHDYCIEMAALVKATLESVGLVLDMSQVVMRQYAPSTEREVASEVPRMSVGVEVV